MNCAPASFHERNGDGVGEFEFIKKYLAPLTAGDTAALGLKDDAAVLSCPSGREWVITTDALSCGTHFFPTDDPGLVAGKVLRVNLSDLAAMGAAPKYYLLTGFSAQDTTEAWLKKFVSGLKKTQSAFGLVLIGGDTVRHHGPLAFSITMIGEVKKGKALLRSGARPDDDVYVSGTIGNAALGLKILQGALKPKSKYLVSRYHTPEPRIALGKALSGAATSCIDISDGLMADAAHIAQTSGVRMEIKKQSIPLSSVAQEFVKADAYLFVDIIAGGDDYELLFTAPPSKAAFLRRLSEQLNLPLTKIGRVTSGKGIVLLDGSLQPIPLPKMGYTHF